MQPSVIFPPIGDAVTGELAGVVTRRNIEMAVVAMQIVEAVWMNDPFRQRGKIVVEGLDDLLRVSMARSKEVANQFLFLGVNAENGIRRLFIKAAVMGDDFELAIPLRMAFERAFFQGFASPETVLMKQLDHHLDTDAEATRGQFLREAAQGEVGPQNPFAHRISRRMGANDIEEGGVEIGKQRQTRFSSAPFFWDRPGERDGSCRSSRRPRRMVFLSQSKSCDR
jgi:hypothetical protein